MQVMRDLRSGKSLRKVHHHQVCPAEYHHQSYELTPYEALMKDIKDKKYQLKQVMVRGLYVFWNIVHVKSTSVSRRVSPSELRADSLRGFDEGY